ncbi:MAG: GtrA family protein [Corynebacterium sp.]|nr:GtrA family protein [Corynebacterium sp.]
MTAITEPDNSLRTQLTKFIAVGVVCAVIDMGLTFLLDYLFGMPRQLAKAFGWVAGTVSAYFMNAKWTFNSTVSTKKTVAVALLYGSTFAVQSFLYWLVPKPLVGLAWPDIVVDIISFIIAQGAATVTNFAMQRAFIFNDQPNPSESSNAPATPAGDTDSAADVKA